MGETRIDRDVRINKEKIATITEKLANISTGGVDVDFDKLVKEAVDKIEIPVLEVPEVEIPEADFGPIEQKIIDLNVKLNTFMEVVRNDVATINAKLDELFEHPSIKPIVEDEPVPVEEEVVEETIAEEKPPEEANPEP